MHIVLVNRWYPPRSGHGGVAMYNYYLAHALVKLGHRVTVVSARHSEIDPSHEMDGDISIHRLYQPYRYRLHRLPLLGRYMRALQEFIYSHKVAQRLNKLTLTELVDIIEFADVNAEGFIYLRQKKRIPVIVRCHTPMFILKQYAPTGSIHYDTRVITWMEKVSIQAADGLTAPSADMSKVIQSSCPLNGKSIVVIPNPLDTNLFCRADQSHRNPDRDLTILHVGRLDRIKGLEVLIQAATVLVKHCPSIHFVLVGGGPVGYFEKLRQLVHASGLTDAQFQFVGEVSQADLMEWYQRADIAVVPTLNYESFSYTVAQAMACNLPIVASGIGGIPETTGHEGAAILTQPGNVEQLVEALMKLCRNPNIRHAMGVAGRSRAKKYFSDEVVAQRMLANYQSLRDSRPDQHQN